MNATTPPGARARTFAATRLGAAIICPGVAIAQLVAMTTASAAGSSLIVLFALLVAPGVISMVLVPGALRRGYRWLLLWVLCLGMVTPESMPIVLVAGTTWALWVTWWVDKDRPVRGWTWLTARVGQRGGR